MLGPRALTEDEINKLKRLGFLRESVKNFVGDAYLLGKIVENVGTSAKTMTYEQIKKAALKIPMTEVEKRAIEWAQDHTGQYIKGLSDDMVKEVRASAARTSGAALRSVQEEVIDAIRNRRTAQQLASDLFSAIDDRTRDWRRIAFTEMNEAIQKGIYSEILKHSEDGADQLVFKRPNPDGCKHCKRLFLQSDGTPKVFRLGDLADTNYGLKAADWKPVIGSVHPWCQCQLQVIPEGYDFRKDPHTEKIQLVFTGETARPTTEKSLTNEPISDTDHDCVHCY